MPLLVHVPCHTPTIPLVDILAGVQPTHIIIGFLILPHLDLTILAPLKSHTLVFFEICKIQGHTAKYCPSYKFIHVAAPNHNNSGLLNSPWQPKAHFATNSPHNNAWLLDSGASHHVTSDLNNLSLHTSYNGLDDIMIGDGTGLPITHTGSTSLLHSNKQFSLTDVLCVPNITKNLISISKFCISNNASIEFLSFLFVVKDLHIGVTLLKGKTKDGVYEWPPSTPLIAFSSIKTTSFNWHHRLGQYPALPILKHIISKNALDLASSSMLQFSCNACCRTLRGVAASIPLLNLESVYGIYLYLFGHYEG